MTGYILRWDHTDGSPSGYYHRDEACDGYGFTESKPDAKIFTDRKVVEKVIPRYLALVSGPNPFTIEEIPLPKPKKPRSLIHTFVQDLVLTQLVGEWTGGDNRGATDVSEYSDKAVEELGTDMASVQWDDLVGRLPVEFRHLLEGKNPFGEVY